MSKDTISNRFERKKVKTHLDDIAHRDMTAEEVEAEEEFLANAEKVKPIHAEGKPGRNDPCPCGSGKKYKKCCAKEE